MSTFARLFEPCSCLDSLARLSPRKSAQPPFQSAEDTANTNKTGQNISPNALSQAADASCSRLSCVARQKGVLTAQNFVSSPLHRLSRQQQKTQKRPRFQPPKPPKNTRANTPRVIFITSRTNLTINEKPHSEGRRHTPPVTRDSGLNRHGSLPLPGGDCISLPSER